jgi:pimeloyl-ACP methyl ester carboxylesterase
VSASLHTTTYGDRGRLVVFCHGLFGQGRNWTQIGKALADEYRVVLADMPHHGRSPWTGSFDYLALADQVAGLLPADEPAALVGHSMGGKIAMLVALRRPELVERLGVVDVSPVAYPQTDEFAGYVDAMQRLDLSVLERRADADAALSEAVPHPTIRSFLLQNLRRGDDGWSWQLNLDVLGEHLDELRDWPAERLGDVAPYDGPVLWLGGARSDYVRDEYAPAMNALFPRNRRVTVKNAGHWVHSEQPEVFVEVLRRFLR